MTHQFLQDEDCVQRSVCACARVHTCGSERASLRDGTTRGNVSVAMGLLRRKARIRCLVLTTMTTLLLVLSCSIWLRELKPCKAAREQTETDFFFSFLFLTEMHHERPLEVTAF